MRPIGLLYDDFTKFRGPHGVILKGSYYAFVKRKSSMNFGIKCPADTVPLFNLKCHTLIAVQRDVLACPIEVDAEYGVPLAAAAA